MTADITLVRPARAHLASYRAALERGWSPDNVRLEAAISEQLAAIDADADAFLASLDDPGGKQPPFVLPDGSTVKRLPSIRRWVWDGEAAGSIGMRWQPGTADLPPHVLGHIGYAIVPWKRGRGYATQALALMLEEARRLELPHVGLTTDPGNATSQKVVRANGGVFVEEFDAIGYGKREQRFRITL